MEQLARALCDITRSAPLAPLTPEVVIVPSKGVERWLTLELAQALGVCAHVRFPFPRTFVDDAISAVLADEDPKDRFTRESLCWAIASLLPDLCREPELGEVARYLEGAEEQKLFGLANRIAHSFDQYAVFRPDLVQSWERGAGSGWQPVLWRALVSRLGDNHLGARLARFRERFVELPSLPPELPSRVSAFGISALSPSYLELLSLLGTRMEVHAFLLSPSAKIVADLASRKDELRRRWQLGHGLPRDAKHEPDVRGLTRSMGRVAWETESILACVGDVVSDDKFVAPPTTDALGVLVSEALGLEESGDLRYLARDDRSIAVHACHGPMREIEVLRDQLRALFEADATLEPRDVVVFLCDVERYAPFVDAVFAVDPSSAEYIPYRISDRSQRSTSVVAGALLALLEMLGGRFGASAVLDLLKLEPIRDKAGLVPEEIARLEDWLLEVGVRFGIDADHKSEEGLPAQPEGTWRFGLTRLLLGFALPGEDHLLFEGSLPYDAIEGKEALAAGKLAELVERLIAFRERLSQPLTPVNWQVVLGDMLSAFVLLPEHASWQLSATREAIESFVEGATRAGFDQPIGRAALVDLLTDVLERERVAHAFLSGGVTFCSLTPMRSIPFRVVCLVGMSDGQFPRQSSALAFDEMAKEPRVGDRATRDEDRLAFLEALLSARERVIITYVGRGLRDDAKLPPSVVVGELLDALDARFTLDDGTARTPARGRPRKAPPAEQLALFRNVTPAPPPPRAAEPATTRIIVEHPLQAFSLRYFDDAREDARLFSYGQIELGGARALVAEPTVQPPLFPTPLATEPLPRIDLDELAVFFDHPARFLLERRATLDLRERSKFFDEREPVEPDGLEAHVIGQWVLGRVLEGLDHDTTYTLTRATGKLASGTLGRVHFEEYWQRASTLGRIVLAERGSGPQRRMDVTVALGERVVEGVVDRIWPKARVSFAYSARPARVELELWIRHLALSAANLGLPSILVRRAGDGAKVEVVRLPALDPELAKERLAQLVTIFDIGQQRPLCFFPRSARVFAQKLWDNTEHSKALRAAHAEFSNSKDELGEGHDPYFSRLFPGTEALGDDYDSPTFAALATGVYVPFLDVAERETFS
jgi:exodeoxyribonuclease V gamma subunit